MKSIQTKLVAIVLACVLLSCVAIGSAGLITAQHAVDESSTQIMNLLCEKKAAQFDVLLSQIEQSVQILSEYIQRQMESAPSAWDDAEEIEKNVAQFELEAMHFAESIKGVKSVHFRLLPSFAGEEYIFLWQGYEEQLPQEPNTFFAGAADPVPREPAWIEPDSQEEMGSWAAAYVAPIILDGQPVGVIGMDVDTAVFEAAMESVSLYESGYAFMYNDRGIILYHPSIAFGTPLSYDEDLERVASRVAEDSSGDSLLPYRWHGEKKALVFRTLKNGIRLSVTAPMKEINAERNQLVTQNVLVLLSVAAIAVALAMGFAKRLIRPLRELNIAAQKIAEGDFSTRIQPSGNDEVSDLARSFQKSAERLQHYITELNSLAYRDTMTGVRNKSAYLEAAQRMQARMQTGTPCFALVMMDVNFLKATNDTYGHDFGDKLIINGCQLICQTFKHSPVYRFGGDEFVVILENRDFENRDALIEQFRQAMEVHNQTADSRLKLSISWGMAVFDDRIDHTFDSVFKRADDSMYENKKAVYAGEGEGRR